MDFNLPFITLLVLFVIGCLFANWSTAVVNVKEQVRDQLLERIVRFLLGLTSILNLLPLSVEDF